MNTNSDKQKMPSLKEIQSGIDQLLLIEDWNQYKVKRSPKKFQKRLHELFTSKFSIFPTVLTPLESNSIPFTFFRLRKFDSKMNTSLISEYSYPPNHVVKYTQRANLPYHPVFYCSNNPATAIFETIRNEKKHNTDDFYYLSSWVLKPDHMINFSPFIFGNLHQDSPYVEWTKANYIQIDKSLGHEFDPEGLKSFKKILEFLSHLFVYENTYAVSSYIAHEHLYAQHNYRSDIFMYPSWQTDRKSLNFAIHPNTVIEKMQLKKVYKMTISDFQEDRNSYNTFISKIANNKNGILYWRQIDENDEELTNDLEKFF